MPGPDLTFPLASAGVGVFCSMKQAGNEIIRAARETLPYGTLVQ